MNTNVLTVLQVFWDREEFKQVMKEYDPKKFWCEACSDNELQNK